MAICHSLLTERCDNMITQYTCTVYTLNTLLNDLLNVQCTNTENIQHHALDVTNDATMSLERRCLDGNLPFLADREYNLRILYIA